MAFSILPSLSNVVFSIEMSFYFTLCHFIWTGYLFGAVSRIGYALSMIWQHLIPFRMIDRTGKIGSTPRDVIVADISTQENRGLVPLGILRKFRQYGQKHHGSPRKKYLEMEKCIMTDIEIFIDKFYFNADLI